MAATAIPTWRTMFHTAPPTATADEGVHLAVDLSERRLVVHDGGETVTTYGVAIGAPKYPTPTGTFSIRKIVWNPPWIPPDRDWAKDKEPARNENARFLTWVKSYTKGKHSP